MSTSSGIFKKLARGQDESEQFPLLPFFEQVRASLRKWPPSGAQIAAILAIAVTYFLVAQLGLKVAIGGGVATPAWPPSGLALAAMLMFGRRVWPGVWLGAFAMSVVNLLHRNPDADRWPAMLLSAGGNAIAATLAAGLGCALVQRVSGRGNPLDRLPGVIAVLGLGGIVSCVVSATIGVGAVTLGGFASRNDFGQIWLTWWLGDAAGVFVFAPLFLAWCGRPAFLPKVRAWEAALCAVLLMAAYYAVFIASTAPGTHGGPFAFVLIPFLVWPALRFGQRGAALAVLVTTAVSVWGTIHGWGPFDLATLNQSLLVMETFLCVATLTALCGAAVVTQRNLADTVATQRTGELRESVAWFRSVIETTPECVQLLDEDGSVLEMNPAGLRVLEADSIDQVRHQRFKQFVAEEYRAPFQDLSDRVIRGDSGMLEYLFTGLKGTRRWLETHASPMRDASGRVTALLGVTRDVTGRRDAEQPLRMMHYSVEHACDSVFWFRRDGLILYANDSACGTRGYTREELLKMTLFDLDPDWDTGIWQKHFDELKQRGSITFETRHRAKDGHFFPVEVSANFVGLGVMEFSFATVRDITERRHAEELAAARSRSLLELARSTPANLDAALREITRMTGRLLRVNRAGVWLFTPDHQTLRCEVLYVADRESFESGATLSAERYPHYFAVLNDRKVTSIDNARTHPATSEFTDDYLIPLGITSLQDAPLWRDGKVVGVLCAEHTGPARTWSSAEASLSSALADQVVKAMEEHERKDAEAARFEMLARFSGFAEASQCGLGISDLQGHLIFANSTLARIYGEKSADDCLGKYFPTTYYPEAIAHRLRDEVLPTLLKTGSWHGELELRTSDGRHVPTDENYFVIRDEHGQPCRFAVILTDITTRRALEENVRQSQKMEAVGQLAGGVAHDFNNILSAILGNVWLAQSDLPAGHPALESLSEIQRAGDRAKDLIRQILAFSRRQTRERRVLGLGTVIGETVNLLRATLPAGVELVTSIASDAPNVLADATQLHQILLNLGTNAWHALDGNAGRIEIKLESAMLDATACQSTGVKPGRFACLSVTDSGRGMDAATIAQIFEPFFTTKDVGKGTGLGLSVVHGLVQDHDGAITVQSQPGAGTTFRVYLPAVDSAASELAEPQMPFQQGHGEHILYLDDEESLVHLATRMIERLGYRITGFTRPAAALAAFRENPDRFDLFITDLNMPGSSGLSVAVEVLKLRPNMPVVLTSGHITDELRQQALHLGVRRVLYKPNTLAEFSEEISQLLAESRPA